MKAVRYILLAVVAVFVFCLAIPSSFAQCSQPGTITITYSWTPNIYVDVISNNVPNAPVATAANNWNGGFGANPLVCSAPHLFNGNEGSSSKLNMSYASIPPPTPCPSGSTCFTRGITDLTNAQFTAGRISTVNMTINTVVTDSNALTEVIAHEFGHTFALTDCNYPSCPVGSSVMESGAPASSVNSLIGQPGPTSCDITAVLGVAIDYTYGCAPPPPPPPQDCDPNYCTDTCCVSPIIIDTSGQGFLLTDAKHGVVFDMRGTGASVRLAWTAAGANNAFLALPASDGMVHNGKQLFGNFTSQPPSTTPNGFAALAVFDQPANGGNGDGVIDSKDGIFPFLRLWIDANHDGIAQEEELHTLPSLGVESISLDYHLSHHRDQYGNLFRYRARVNPGEATSTGRMAYDVFLVPSTTSANASAGAKALAKTKARACSRPAVWALKQGSLPTGR